MVKSESVRTMCATIAKDVSEEYKTAFMGAPYYRTAKKAEIDIRIMALESDWHKQLEHILLYLQRDRVELDGDRTRTFENDGVNLPLKEIEARILRYYNEEIE